MSKETKPINFLIQCVLHGDIKKLKQLLQLKSPDLHDSNGWTPIHHAAFRGKLEMLQLLLTGRRRKYLLSLETWKRETPLVLACSRTDIMRNFETIKFILSCNANINHRACFGETALYRACQRPGSLPVVKYLLQRGANPDLEEHVNCFKPVHIILSTSKDLELLQHLISVTDFSTCPNEVTELACDDWDEAVPYLLPFIKTTVRGIKRAIALSNWDFLCHLIKRCTQLKSVCLPDEDRAIAHTCRDTFKCKLYLPVHFVIQNPPAFEKVLNAFPPALLTSYENSKTMRNVRTLPFWIAAHSPFPDQTMETLLQYNARHGRLQKIGNYKNIGKKHLMIVRKYFTFGECKLPQSISNMCRIVYKKFIRSQCDSDWQAYCYLKDCPLPVPIKNLLLSNEDFDRELDKEVSSY